MKIKIIVILFIFGSCVRQDENYPKQSILDQEMIDYFGCFKEGSWWVYYDSLRNTYDTMKVTKYEKSNVHAIVWAYGINNTKNYRYDYRTDEKNSIISHEFNYYTGSDFIYNWEAQIEKHNDSFIRGYNSGPLFFIDSLIINNTLYKNILVNNGFYFVKKIGMVLHYDTTIFGRLEEKYKLIDYHINY